MWEVEGHTGGVRNTQRSAAFVISRFSPTQLANAERKIKMDDASPPPPVCTKTKPRHVGRGRRHLAERSRDNEVTADDTRARPIASSGSAVDHDA